MSHSKHFRAIRPALFVIPALLAWGSMTLPTPARAQIGISISATVAPPELPIYAQPPLPGPGYLWTPGYWAYGDAGYYWVPGTWVEPPSVGLLWTPGYWGFAGGQYVFNAGYWGATVGFYGGINYGFGFGGVGYEGGFWRDGVFSYNRSVNNFGGVHITNVYNKTVTNVTETRASFNGPGGVTRTASAAELTAAHERHVEATAAQMQHREMAAKEPALRASENHGHPAITATSRPGELKGATEAEHPARAEAKPGEARPAETRASEARTPAAHPAETASHERAAPEVRRGSEMATHTEHRAEPAAHAETTPHEATSRVAHSAPPMHHAAPRPPMTHPVAVHREAAPRPEHAMAAPMAHPAAPHMAAPPHPAAPHPGGEEKPK